MDSAGHPSRQRVSVDEAARALGLTVDAVRKRVQRGTIEHERDRAGRVRITLDSPDNTSTVQDERPDTTGQAAVGANAREELVEELRDRVASLERQLQRRADETERLHQIVAGLAQANAEQARTIRAIEAPATQEAPEDAETVEEEPGGTESQSEAAGAQAGAESVPGTTEGDEATQQEEPQAWEASEGDSGDRTLADSPEQSAEAAVVPGPVEEQRDAQEPETAETELDGILDSLKPFWGARALYYPIASGDVQQEHPDDTPSDEQEEAAESPGSVEDVPQETAEGFFEERRERLRREREALERRIEERRAAPEERIRQVEEAIEQREAAVDQGPWAGEASAGADGDQTLPEPEASSDTTDEDEPTEQDPETVETDIATGEVQQAPSDDTPPGWQEAEIPISAADERVLHAKKGERIFSPAEERRAASEAARRRPWYRRIFGR